MSHTEQRAPSGGWGAFSQVKKMDVKKQIKGLTFIEEILYNIITSMPKFYTKIIFC